MNKKFKDQLTAGLLMSIVGLVSILLFELVTGPEKWLVFLVTAVIYGFILFKFGGKHL